MRKNYKQKTSDSTERRQSEKNAHRRLAVGQYAIIE